MILVGIGSNLPSAAGPPPQTVRAAVAAMQRHGLAIRASSSLWHSPPFPKSAQPWFANAVVQVSTPLGPEALMHCLHEVERQFGRRRRIKWAARPLDLDLLDYDGMVIGAARANGDHLSRPLILPHPAVEVRNFVLRPLAEIAPGWQHPQSRKGVKSLILQLPKGQIIRKGGTILPF